MEGLNKNLAANDTLHHDQIDSSGQLREASSNIQELLGDDERSVAISRGDTSAVTMAGSDRMLGSVPGSSATSRPGGMLWERRRHLI